MASSSLFLRCYIPKCQYSSDPHCFALMISTDVMFNVPFLLSEIIILVTGLFIYYIIYDALFYYYSRYLQNLLIILYDIVEEYTFPICIFVSVKLLYAF